MAVAKMVNNNMIEKQRNLYKLLLVFDNFCLTHNINYSLACGTALGAVRENGFILWDGDLDIMMTFPEYKKIEAIKEKLTKCSWVDYKTSNYAPVLFARIYNKEVDYNTLENEPYIDINVYSGGPEKSWVSKFVLILSKINFKIFWLKKRNYKNIFYRRKSVIGRICQILLFWFPAKLCVKIFEYLLHKWPFEQANKIIALQGYYGERETLSKTWFDSYTQINFEVHNFKIISNYEQYLRKLYGDYMTPVQYKRYKT